MIDEQFYNSGELDRGVFEPFYGKYRDEDIRDKIFSEEEKSEKYVTFVHQSVPTSSELREVSYSNSKIEFSVYDGDKNLQYWNRNEDFLAVGSDFQVDVRRHIEEANIPDGANYILRYNLFNEVIGGPNKDGVYIKSISTDRTEVRIRIHPEAPNQKYFNETFASKPDPLKYVGNFGNNKYQHILNWGSIARRKTNGNLKFDGNGNPSLKEVIIRFEDPISENIEVGENFWIDFEIGRPYFDRFEISRSEPEPTGNSLAGPNFGVDFEKKKTKESGFETFEELAQGKGFQTSQNFIKSRISTSEAVELNIDFTEFDNFIQYSSAEERIRNFRYKIKNIHQKVLKINDAKEQSAGIGKRLKQDVESIIGSFDAYEQWLFRDEKGYPKNQNGGLKRAVKPERKDFDDAGKYQKSLQEWEEVRDWFEEKLTEASKYDDSNDSALRKNIPEFVRENKENEDFILFVDMIAHWFDMNWIYIKHMQYLTEGSESPHEPETLSADLSNVVAESFGFETYNGFNAEDFFDKIFDSDKIDSLFKDADLTFSSTKEVVDGTIDLTRYQAQQQVWRRLLQNVMHFYKTKSTPSSIRTLTNILGIPPGSLVVRESGGTSPDFDQKTQLDEKTRYISLFSSQSVRFPWNNFEKNPKSVEVRFRTNFEGARSLKVLEVENVVEVRMVKSGLNTDQGRIIFDVFNPDGTTATVKSEEFAFYNGEWTNILVQVREASEFADLIIQQRSPFGNKRFEEQLSVKVNSQTDFSFQTSSNLHIGGRSSGRIFDEGIPFIGDFDQVNIWNGLLTKSQFDKHTFAPKNYDYKNRESISLNFSGEVQQTVPQSTEDFRGKLIFRTDFDENLNNPSKVSNKVTENEKEGEVFGSGAKYEEYTRTNFFSPSQVGNTSFIKNKTRTKERSEENINLFPDRSTKGKFRDVVSGDSEQLGIYFSPNTFANRDVISEMGIESINKVLGNPADQFREDYFTLDTLRYLYWQKFDEPVEVQKYIRYVDQFYDALFDHIEKTIPARAAESTGVVIEPSILERDRHKIPNGSIIVN